jgi:hypothetical protein
VTAPIRREDVAVLAAFERDQSGRSAFPEDSIERLVKLGFLDMRGGSAVMTQRGRTELARRKSLDRQTRK